VHVHRCFELRAGPALPRLEGIHALSDKEKVCGSRANGDVGRGAEAD
jgi:hypothetical protein